MKRPIVSPLRRTLLAIPLALNACTEPDAARDAASVEHAPQALARQPGKKERHDPEWLEVKFQHGSRVRLRGGRPVDLDGRRLTSPAARGLLRRLEAGAWVRSHQVEEDALEALRQEGERHSSRRVPDLNLYFRLRVPPGQDIESVRTELAALEDVEAVYRVPLPVEAPVPPDYSNPTNVPTQGYLNAAPYGVDARAAWNTAGGRGTGVRVCDVEYSFNVTHDEIAGIVARAGSPGWDPFNDNNHGTAVLSIIGGRDEGFGVRGIADQAGLFFAFANTGSGYNVGAAVTACSSAMGPGDVIVIEQQTGGPNGQYVPVEWHKPWYDAIVAAVAAGRVVVEAAGNGRQNLDDASYQTGNGGHYPFLPQNDSGAIIVGAGQSPVSSSTPRAPSWFTTYGSTVDIQAWGDSVVAAGYGNHYSSEGMNRWYTHSFSGTSSATALVGGVAASLQGVHRARRNNTPATPAQIKTLLQTGATPQQGSGHIGGLPNLAASIGLIPEHSGSVVRDVAEVTSVSDVNWHIEGNGDFNRDGALDLIWRNHATGSNYIWFLGGPLGSDLTSGAGVNSVSDLNWHIEGVGDFNRDGALDLIWRNHATGSNYIWFLGGPLGSDLTSGAGVQSVSDLNWHIEGVGDFNRDGALDLFWRNHATGSNYIWFLGGPLGSDLISGAGVQSVSDLNWHVKGIADFNRDGALDLIWRNHATGSNYIWYLGGATGSDLTHGASVRSVSDPGWQLDGAGDFDRDGVPDLVWRNYIVGNNYLWFMGD